jgi:hypothetical protein
LHGPQAAGRSALVVHDRVGCRKPTAASAAPLPQPHLG